MNIKKLSEIILQKKTICFLVCFIFSVYYLIFIKDFNISYSFFVPSSKINLTRFIMFIINLSYSLFLCFIFGQQKLKDLKLSDTIMLSILTLLQPFVYLIMFVPLGIMVSLIKNKTVKE